MIKTILFDLDGTLLPMDQDKFTQSYFHLLIKTMVPYGYEKDALIQSIWKGIKAMIGNDGSCTNEERFWKVFTQIYGCKAKEDKPLFDHFYKEPFQKVAESCGFTDQASALIRWLKEKKYQLILATNPIFPAIATESRIHWAGLDENDFAWITTYENSHFCKPNLAYYEEILKQMHLRAEDCLMIGNDVDEDMIAARLSMKVFLLTDCLINKSQNDLSCFPHGNFSELFSFLNQIDEKR